jgi:hypothetical protein
MVILDDKENAYSVWLLLGWFAEEEERLSYSMVGGRENLMAHQVSIERGIHSTHGYAHSTYIYKQ